jgi:hypothetical protein
LEQDFCKFFQSGLAACISCTSPPSYQVLGTL